MATGPRWNGGLRLMKNKLLVGVVLLMIGSGSALAVDLAVKPAAPALVCEASPMAPVDKAPPMTPVYKAPPMTPAVPPSGQDQTDWAPITDGDWKIAALGCTMRCLSSFRQIQRLVVGRDNQPTTPSTKRLRRSTTSSWQTPRAISRARCWKKLSTVSQSTIAITPTMDFFGRFAALARIKSGSR